MRVKVTTGRVGRRTKLTPELQGQIVAKVRLGAFDWVAAAAAGIAPRTFYEWMERGEGRHRNRAANRAFAQFAQEVRQARAEARVEAEWAVRKEKPLEWLRLGPGRDRGPQEPGWTERTEVTGNAEAPVEHVVRIVRE